ncbi:MAG: YggT family protein [Candidatus Shapirobacteria bacterium]|nr:YggT family protein [Candidatus Shapirobacteria bacterium]
MKEIITTPIISTPVRTGATNKETIEYLVYFFFGLLEVLLAFRLILKLTGASITSGFVGFVYGITGIFILPFQGIFRQAYVSTSVLEPSVIVAFFVYILLAWGIVSLLRISSGEKQES